MLMARSGHINVASVARYAKVSAEQMGGTDETAELARRYPGRHPRQRGPGRLRRARRLDLCPSPVVGNSPVAGSRVSGAMDAVRARHGKVSAGLSAPVPSASAYTHARTRAKGARRGLRHQRADSSPDTRPQWTLSHAAPCLLSAVGWLATAVGARRAGVAPAARSGPAGTALPPKGGWLRRTRRLLRR